MVRVLIVRWEMWLEFQMYNLQIGSRDLYHGRSLTNCPGANPKEHSYDMPTYVPVEVYCLTITTNYLTQCLPGYTKLYGDIKPQWVKTMILYILEIIYGGPCSERALSLLLRSNSSKFIFSTSHRFWPTALRWLITTAHHVNCLPSGIDHMEKPEIFRKLFPDCAEILISCALMNKKLQCFKPNIPVSYYWDDVGEWHLDWIPCMFHETQWLLIYSYWERKACKSGKWLWVVWFGFSLWFSGLQENWIYFRRTVPNSPLVSIWKMIASTGMLPRVFVQFHGYIVDGSWLFWRIFKEGNIFRKAWMLFTYKVCNGSSMMHLSLYFHSELLNILWPTYAIWRHGSWST